MLINKFTKIIGQDVILVPYRKEHVPKYHKWMQSEELQHLTASEPLTLEEEYDMQHSWMIDENSKMYSKGPAQLTFEEAPLIEQLINGHFVECTFIVLDKHLFDKNQDEIEAMIGDTNLFFANEENHMVAEAEIMIAEEGYRGQHRGWQAIILMLLYGINHLDVQQYVVKVSSNNNASINLFGKMGFEETSHSTVFNEVTLNKIVDKNWQYWLKHSVGEFTLINENESN